MPRGLPQTTYLPPPFPMGLGFSVDEVPLVREAGELLRITLEIEESRCNLRCRYCWADRPPQHPPLLTLNEILALLQVSKECGVRTVVLTGGGEPLLDFPTVCSVVQQCKALGLWVVVFTNGTCISEALVREFQDMPITLMCKLNSLQDAAITDWMSGKVGAHRRMLAGIEMLLAAGWHAGHRIGTESVVLRKNLAEIPGLWRWCRSKGIVPFVEVTKRCGRFGLPSDEYPDSGALGALFRDLLRIDQTEFGFTWTPVPPIAALGCDKWHYALYVSARGEVRPCSGVNLRIGNIRELSLQEIMASPLSRRVRDVNKHLGGRCANCAFNSTCYGCRAEAYTSSGDAFGEDPTCWVGREVDPATEAPRGHP